MKPTPQLFRYVRPVLAIATVVFSFGFLFTIVWKDLPEGSKEIIALAAGYTLSQVSNIYSYYFGTSKDKSDQEQASAFTLKTTETAIVNAETATVNTQTTTP